jgi:hypothetical protein
MCAALTTRRSESDERATLARWLGDRDARGVPDR